MEIICQENMFETENIKNLDQISSEELKAFLADKKSGNICFTGHRPEHLPWGNNENCEIFKHFIIKLENVVRTCIDLGYDNFISGMAIGFDIIAAETVLKYKINRSYVSLSLALPYSEQGRNFKGEWGRRHKAVCIAANAIVNVSPEYYEGCFMKRNKFMVDKSDVVIACYNGNNGGTLSTIRYAIKQKKKVLIIKP